MTYDEMVAAIQALSRRIDALADKLEAMDLGARMRAMDDSDLVRIARESEGVEAGASISELMIRGVHWSD